ncbi:MAG: hypothetical protein ACI9CA_001974, partial [Natronomonas sp.]|jgi:hypothetical protein
MADGNLAYRAMLLAIVIIGLGATALGFGGLFVVLTGGTTDGPPDADVLGAYECSGFDGDPEVKHEAAYQIEQTLVGGSQVESFNASTNSTQLRVELTATGQVLNASASRADGTRVPVQQPAAGSRVVVAGADPAPLRLWVDSLSDESTVTRTRLDICPPDST